MKQPHRSAARTTLLGLVIAAGGATGCHGVIGNGNGQSGATSSGVTTTNPPGVTAGAAGAGGNTPGQTATASGPPVLDSGRTTLRRLNRTEYDNTVRDLLGTKLTPATTFPADDVSDGFDTIGNTLSISTVLMQGLEAAAASLVDELFARTATDTIRSKILSCDLKPGSELTCAQQILGAFLPRAFRRPAQPTELAGFVQIVQGAMAAAGTGSAATATAAQDGLKAALEGVLLSPNFLFLVERDSKPGSADAVPLSDAELATRLSYLVWSTMPDDALTAAAAAGQLAGNPAGIAAQLKRMLADPKAAAFAQDFGGEWLQVNYLDTASPSVAVYPGYDDALRTSARQETILFFQNLLDDDQPLETLVTANFSVLNARLGKQYGVAVSGQGFSKTSLAGTPRVGLLTQDSLLMGKSYPDRTSPVKRGYFVLSQLLCIPPPPPPPNVPTLPVTAPGATLTARQVLDAHASNAGCSGCHNLMDPIGYGLENFDGIGGYRTLDNGSPVDASGVFPGGQPFNGVNQLAAAIASDRHYAPCVTQQLLTYGTGRSFDTVDGQAYATALASQLVKQGKATWKQLVSTIATSDAFMTRRGEATP